MKILILIIWLTKNWSVNAEDNYALTPINASPGLYFEKLHNIRFKRAEWRLVLHMDIDRIGQQLPEELHLYAKTMKECKLVKEVEGSCETLLRKELVEKDIQIANELLNEIKELSGEISILDIDNLPHSIVKRGAPFEFVGSASRYLFGTLTKEDGDYFTGEIDKLYQTQTRLTKILKNQTHLISSKLHDLDNKLEDHRIGINQNKDKINDVIASVNILTTEGVLRRYREAMWNYSGSLEHSLEHYITSATKFLQAIHRAREGKIDRYLLTDEQLKSIIREIHESVDKYELPLPRYYHRGEEITKLAITEMGFYEGKIMIILRLPLVERTTYHLYQMHTWPASQRVGNVTITAQIIPQASHIGLSDDHRTYFLPDENYLRECIVTWYCHMCPLQLPLIETATSTTCEVLLLLKPDSGMLRQCDIRLKPGHEPFWTRLNSIGAWLYSLGESESIQIICKNTRDQLISITGSGILYLKEKCMGKTHYVTLPGVEIFTQQKQYLYQPELTLNLSKISPLMHNYHLLEYLKQEPERDKTEFDVGKSLYEVENQIEELGTHRGDKTHQEHLVYGSYMAVITLAVVIIGICCRKQIIGMISNLRLKRAESKDSHQHEKETIELTEIVTANEPELSGGPSVARRILPGQEAHVD